MTESGWKFAENIGDAVVDIVTVHYLQGPWRPSLGFVIVRCTTI